MNVHILRSQHCFCHFLSSNPVSFLLTVMPQFSSEELMLLYPLRYFKRLSLLTTPSMSITLNVNGLIKVHPILFKLAADFFLLKLPS